MAIFRQCVNYSIGPKYSGIYEQTILTNRFQFDQVSTISQHLIEHMQIGQNGLFQFEGKIVYRRCPNSNLGCPNICATDDMLPDQHWFDCCRRRLHF